MGGKPNCVLYSVFDFPPLLPQPKRVIPNAEYIQPRRGLIRSMTQTGRHPSFPINHHAHCRAASSMLPLCSSCWYFVAGVLGCLVGGVSLSFSRYFPFNWWCAGSIGMSSECHGVPLLPVAPSFLLLILYPFAFPFIIHPSSNFPPLPPFLLLLLSPPIWPTSPPSAISTWHPWHNIMLYWALSSLVAMAQWSWGVCCLR